VYEAVSKLKIGVSHQSSSLQGSLGYGKSHILAALACLLFREGKLLYSLPARLRVATWTSAGWDLGLVSEALVGSAFSSI
jgi:DNA replication protein DnaC